MAHGLFGKGSQIEPWTHCGRAEMVTIPSSSASTVDDVLGMLRFVLMTVLFYRLPAVHSFSARYGRFPGDSGTNAVKQ